MFFWEKSLKKSISLEEQIDLIREENAVMAPSGVKNLQKQHFETN